MLQMVGCGSVDDLGLLHIANGCAALKVNYFINYCLLFTGLLSVATNLHLMLNSSELYIYCILTF